MTAFQDMLKADAENLMEEFGESIQYTNAVTGLRTTINAVVVRNPPEKTGATPRNLSEGILVHIPKSQITRPNRGADTVKLSDSEKHHLVVKLMEESDPGMWNLVIN